MMKNYINGANTTENDTTYDLVVRRICFTDGGTFKPAVLTSGAGA